jgi:hypothetical protein
MRIANLINQYPAISHTFIRREILALEQLGFDVIRISIRGWEDHLADDQDWAERRRTRYVLRAGLLGLGADDAGHLALLARTTLGLADEADLK